MANTNSTADSSDDVLYTPKPGERQFTVRAVVTGCLLGGIVSGMNIYLGLKIGWSVGGSLMAAILSFAFWSAVKPRNEFGVLETNIAQTAGSGAGTMSSAAGLLAPIPAMFMLGFHIPWWGLFLWALSIAYLGVMFAVPLRRQYVVIEKLRFPTGTATANTIVAMYAHAAEAMAKARKLMFFATIAFCFILLSHFWPWIAGKAGFVEWWPSIETLPLAAFGGFLAVAAKWSFSLYLGPMLGGAGLLIGPRVGTSLLLGAVVGWGLLGPYAQSQGWAPHANPLVYHDAVSNVWGAHGWILWPGVAIMVADALTSLALSWRTFVAAFKRPEKTDSENAAANENAETTIPNSWWISGLAAAALSTVIVAQLVFDIPIYLSALAICLSAVLANVAVRSTGETDINPIGGMGKVTQLVYGGLSPSMATNLMAAGITGAGASQAGDMMQDLKTGAMLGASPRQQFKAQLWGILAGVFFCVPLFYLFNSAYEIGATGSPLPAPAAHAWKAMAEVLSQGLGALPPMAIWAALCGLAFGTALPLIRRFIPSLAKFTPNGLAVGIAMIVPAFYSIAMFLGAMVLVFWMKRNKAHCERFIFAVAAGLIAGEGLAGILNAILQMIGIPG